MGLHQKVTIIPADQSPTETNKAKNKNSKGKLFDVKTAVAAFLIAGTLASCGNDYESPETTKYKAQKEVVDKKLQLAKKADEAKEDYEDAKKARIRAEEDEEKKLTLYEEAQKKLLEAEEGYEK